MLLPHLPLLDPRWYENKAQGLVYTRSPTKLTFRLYFPETVGMHDLELVTLQIVARAAHCSVAEPFLRLFDGETRSLFFEDKVLFSSHGGFDREDPTELTADEWLTNNVRAAERLDREISARREFYRDEYLPDWDLGSGIIERMVKDYKFRLEELPSEEDATAEFCRRFAEKPAFKKLFHPELSVRRYFDRAPPR